MSSIKPFRMTYTRIGSNENWAGWQIAGQTEDTPRSVLEEFEKLSDNNAGNATVLFDRSEAREVYEWLCKWDYSKGENVFFTRLKFGVLDDAGARPSMRADSVAVTLGEYPDFFYEPQRLLFIDKTCFENRLLIDAKRDDIGKLRAERTQPDDAYTAFESVDYLTSDGKDMDEMAEIYFETRNAYLTLIRCVYWALTFKSASTVFIVTDLTANEELCVFSLLLRSVISAYRPMLSMRTCDLPQSQPTVVAFCKKIPPGEKYCVLATGENNILNDIVIKRLEKQSFIRSLRDFKNCVQMCDYYLKLDKVLEKLGRVNSTDTGLMEIADYFSKADDADQAQIDHKDLKKVLNRLLHVKYRSKMIDAYTAELIRSASEINIHISEEMFRLMWESATASDNEELYRQVLRYFAHSFIKEEEEDPSQAYKMLREIKNNDIGFSHLRKEILAVTGGKEFLDRFYGRYLGAELEKTEEALRDFCMEVGDLPKKTYIIDYICNEYFERGKKILYELMSGRDKAVDEFEVYMTEVSEIISNKVTARDITERIIEKFWDEFDFADYRYFLHDQYSRIKPKKDYLNKYNICKRITDCFFKVSELKVENVEKLKKIISNPIHRLSAKARENIATEFFDLCVAKCTNDKGVDFWCEVAELKGVSVAECLLKAHIPLFCNPNIFEKEIAKSKKFCEERYCSEFLKGLERYAASVKRKETFNSINMIKKIIIKKKKKKR